MRYLKISAKKSGGAEVSLADVRVSGIILSEDKNVALQKGAEIFYPEGQTGGIWGDAWKMNDGDASTYAQGTANNAVMQMDLRNIFRIDRINLQFYPDGPATAFKIEGSFDGKSWAELASTENAAERNVFLLPEKAAVRYVRLTVTESTAAAYAVTEWEVYGIAETNLANAENTRAVILETGDSVTMWDVQPLRNAFDDDDSTLAQSNTNVPWDLVTDLGGYYSVFAVRYLGDHANKIAKGSLEFSNNGVTFEKLFDIDADSLDAYNHFCIYYPEDVVARYIRLNVEEVQGGGADYGHAVGNFAVYGTPAEKPQIDAESVSILNKGDIPAMMYPGDTFRLQLSLGNNLSADEIVWTSSNPNRLEVSADGTVTAKVLGGTFTVTVQVGDAADTAEFSVYRVINVASRSLVTMENGSPGWGNVASKVVDGDMNSFSQTYGNSAYSLVIDMYGELNIGRVVVYTHAGPPSFTLSVSSDGVTYTEVGKVETVEDFSRYQFDWEAEGGKTFRYLKFSGEKLPLEGIDYGFSIKEIEVYNHTTQSLDNLPEAPVPDNGPWAGDEWQLPAGEGQNEASSYPDTKFGLDGAPENSPYPEQAGTDTAAIVLVCVFAALAVAAGAAMAVYFIKARKPKKEENDE